MFIKGKYALVARHDEMGTERIMSWHYSMEEAREAVSQFEERGVWPEGHEAYLRKVEDQWVMDEFGGWVGT